MSRLLLRHISLKSIDEVSGGNERVGKKKKIISKEKRGQ